MINYGVPLGLAGLGVGMGMIGSGMADAGMPGAEGLVSGGEAAVGFVPVAVNIWGGGKVISMLKGFPRGRI